MNASQAGIDLPEHGFPPLLLGEPKDSLRGVGVCEYDSVVLWSGSREVPQSAYHFALEPFFAGQ